MSAAAGSGAGGKGLNYDRAKRGIRRLQTYSGLAFLTSAVLGVYLLASDKSLWILAISHAYGLVAIVVIDVVIGLLNLQGRRKVYLPSMAAAFLAVGLQLGDILTAPQYGMTPQYFARYLFGLWAFDSIIALQVVVVALGLAGNRYARYLARRKTHQGRTFDYSKRGFMKSIVGFGVLVAVAVGLGSIKLPPPSPAKTTTTGTQGGSSTTSLPGNAVANVNSMTVGTPVYFDYPSGYPNMLVKNADGTLTALSLLCTHVCCQCQYSSAYKEIGCPCHGSVFDLTGRVLRGPAVEPLPKITFRLDSAGNVFPTGVSGSSPCLSGT